MEKIILGRFGAAYGVRGWLHLISFTHPIDNILEHKEWQVKHGNNWVTLHLEKGQIHGKGLVVKIKEINDRELAREYTNDTIAIFRENLPSLSDNEYYWEDLIGTSVITEKGIKLGTVKSLMATGANDVIVVSGDKEILIPYINSVIVTIDLEKKEIIVNWDLEF